jgi:hypothetical protein
MLDAGLQVTFELDRAAAALEAEPHPTCLLGVAGEIMAVNAAWDAFARLNGGAPACLGENLRGKNYFNYIDGIAPRSHYESVWHRVLSGVTMTVESECNSDTMLRDLRSSFRPVMLGGMGAVVVTHRLLRQRDVPGAWTTPPDLAQWVNEDGRLVMCSSCRCVRRVDRGGWDFVPILLQASSATLHAFCPDCEVRLQRLAPTDPKTNSTAQLERQGT